MNTELNMAGNEQRKDEKYRREKLSKLATKPEDARRCHDLSGHPIKESKKTDENYRNIFMSDRDRILYCRSFLRLSGKTQVYAPSSGDHQRTRLTHTLEVSQIARTISQALYLNCDLTEAIALGHDIGHTPFGHAGEQMLHEIMSPKHKNNPNAPKNTTIYRLSDEEVNKYKTLYGFKHNLQSVRCIVEDFEARNDPNGLDLTNYTLWGIMHHSSTKYKPGKVYTDNLTPDFYNIYMQVCYKTIDAPAWSFEAFVVAQADEIAQMHHDLEDAIRRKAMTKEKVIKILSKLKHLMDDNDKETLEDLESKKWVSKEYLIAKSSKIIVNTLVTKLITASRENLFNLIDEYSAEKIFDKCYKDPEITSAISFDIYQNDEDTNGKKIKEFQDEISKAVINTHVVQRSDSKGKYIIKNLFEAYYTNPQQLPDSALKNLYKILKESNYKFIEKAPLHENDTEKEFSDKCIQENYNNEIDTNIFTIESDELRGIISDAVSDIRKTDDKRRDILIMRIICDYIAGMTDSFAISEYEKLYG